MSSNTKLSMISNRKFSIVIFLLLASIIARYYVPVHLPGPMIHPWKYRIISGSFAFILEVVSENRK